MTDFNPGPGWREVNGTDDFHDVVSYWNAASHTWTRWVREEPVPPLPTEPHTVIRTTWQSRDETEYPLTFMKDGLWYRAGDLRGIRPEALFKRITGFEVLSEPRAVTAKAVLDAAEKRSPLTVGDLEELRDEFGVES